MTPGSSQGTHRVETRRAWITRFIWGASLFQTLLETCLLSLLLVFNLSSLAPQVSVDFIDNALMVLGLFSAAWFTLRLRKPAGSRSFQLWMDFAAAMLLIILTAVGVWLPAKLLGWTTPIFARIPGLGALIFEILSTGFYFALFRACLALLAYWEKQRRKSMALNLTHAILMAAMIGGLIVFGVISLNTPRGNLWSASPAFIENPAGWLGFHLFNSYLPSLGLILIPTIILLALLLPPGLLFSYLAARTNTERIKKLAQATSALRQGSYAARVEVSGEDEVTRLQQNFNSMADDLERTLRELQSERDRVDGLLQSRRELVAGVSHDLRTPVTTMRAYLERARQVWREKTPEALEHDFEVLEQNLLQLQGLIEDLFSLSQAEVSQLTLQIQPVVIGAIVQRSVESMAPWAWNTGRVEITAQVDGAIPQALADPGRLQQIMVNLLRNAVQHTQPGGFILAEVSQEAGQVCITVRDTGEGISSEDLPHIWERYYRGKQPAGRAAGGAGLGLALVKELAEAMSGSVSVESVPGQGSCFTVRLPVRQEK